MPALCGAPRARALIPPTVLALSGAGTLRSRPIAEMSFPLVAQYSSVALSVKG